MIEVNNLTTASVDEEFLKRVAKKVLKGENNKENKKDFNISIALVGEKKIQELNKKYLGKNQVTDVLSFGDGLNEIVICPAVVKTKKELARVLIHGILHLLGYEHEKMQEKEEYYAKALHY